MLYVNRLLQAMKAALKSLKAALKSLKAALKSLKAATTVKIALKRKSVGKQNMSRPATHVVSRIYVSEGVSHVTHRAVFSQPPIH